MTREEAIKWFKESAFYHKDHEPFNMAIEALEQEPKSEWQHDHDLLKAYSDGAENMLGKIRAEINKLTVFYTTKDKGINLISQNAVNRILDKYKAESEDNHND